MHLSNLKRLRIFIERPSDELVFRRGDRYNFNEALPPEDSWEGDLDEGKFEVENVLDVRSGRKTRYGRVHRQFLVKWK